MVDNAMNVSALNESMEMNYENFQSLPSQFSPFLPNDSSPQSPPKQIALKDCKTKFRFNISEVEDVLAKGEPVFSEPFSVKTYKNSLIFQLVFVPENLPNVPAPALVPGAPVAADKNANNNNNNNNNKERVNEREQNEQEPAVNQFFKITLRLVHCAKEIDCTVHYRIDIFNCDQELFKEGSIPVNSAILWEDESLLISRDALSQKFCTMLMKEEDETQDFSFLKNLCVKAKVRISKPGDLVRSNSGELCGDFRELLENAIAEEKAPAEEKEKLAAFKGDFHLEVEGVRFPVHKAIISSRSGIIPMAEDGKMQNYRNMDDYCDKELLKELLCFIYSGNFETPPELDNIYYFLNASEEIGINGLKEWCVAFLIKILDMKNLVDVLKISLDSIPLHFILEDVMKACVDLLAASSLDLKHDDRGENKKLWKKIKDCFEESHFKSSTLYDFFKQEVTKEAKKLAKKAAQKKVETAAAAAAVLNAPENGADNANANADVNRVDDRANNVHAGQEMNLAINRQVNLNPNQNHNFNHNFIQNLNFNLNPNLNFNPNLNLIPNRNPNLNVNPIPNYNRNPIPNPPFNPNPNPNFNPNFIPNLNRLDWGNVALIGVNLIGVPAQPVVAPAHPFAPPNFLPQQNPPINPLPVGHYFPFAPAPATVPNNVPVQPVNIGNDALANLMPGNPAAPDNNRNREN